ncbi:DNA-protecting protein DprA [Colwellia sp. MB3u-28]|nr:DNA-protecting protein DprA [Colwellia sp. MB02u-7]MBA6238425.1 DNA-protecting protein DprA [Colwellia sp. MB02u-11]MBA6255199.1 DNA-protecting protein DprA [Colwellia sp. MB3u-28]MBA6260774.1 DNA-protecting protein DprA [Colwellia sp. MB3u-41]MBA6299617.1 DNA-protecting protein DprA [Colwellia sp. MB3u-22]MBA6303417.1 DNA-protecting protein DprA [Colwellia sp. MB02u-14]MBA6310385.1 DNA-protecting protein DprA [Colwellia sp. MB3u-64]
MTKNTDVTVQPRDEHHNKSASHYWLALKLIPRLASHKKLTLVERFGVEKLFYPSQELSSLSLTQKQVAAIRSPDWPRIANIINASKRCGSIIIPFTDIRYPSTLKQIYDPPLLLFVQGNITLLNQQQIAMVGSRNASINGRDNAFEFAQQLVNAGLVITSGLALGIDGAAHKGTLAAKGKTIAVVATGLDQVYPTRHRLLAKNILENDGAIISEFLPGTPPKPGYFPKRNRIISGMSIGVLVVEATIRSGSLVTARCAIEQNREVFAVPSTINNPQAKGCHWLIKQGAKLVDDIADIVDEIDLLPESGLNLMINITKGQSFEKSEKQHLFNDALLASVGYEITPVDIVVSRSKLPINEVLTRLTMLELKGLVAMVPGGYLRVK